MFESKPKKQEAFLETPDVSQKDLLKKANGRAVGEEEIYVMPENFRKKMAKKGMTRIKKRHFSPWTILLVAVLVLIVGGGIFYWWAKSYYIVSLSEQPVSPSTLREEEAPPEMPLEESEEAIIEEPVEELPDESAPLTLRAIIKDAEEAVLSSLELYIPEGAYDPELKPEFNVEELPFNETYASTYDYISYTIKRIYLPINIFALWEA